MDCGEWREQRRLMQVAVAGGGCLPDPIMVMVMRIGLRMKMKSESDDDEIDHLSWRETFEKLNSNPHLGGKLLKS
jgi:hypothetical protein